MDDQRVNREGGGDKMTFIPRDSARIDPMIELLREAWHLAPDWRLTQLIVNVSDVTDDIGSLYCMEDRTTEKKLQALVGGFKALKKRKEK
jgi:hypothetical protein